MDWSNDMVLEFLQYYENETIIWDPRHDNHKKKSLVNDAWRRIKSNISWECNVDDLKKKKDSLMAYYRMHIAKIKKNKLYGTGVEDVYRTSWFAFSTMDSFLRPIYDCSTNICSENEDDTNENSSPVEKIEDDVNYMQTSNSLPLQISKPYRLPTRRKQLNVTHEILTAKKQMKEAFEHIKRNKTNESPTPKVLNEYELFGNLVAIKIQKIQNPVDREILMNDINNLIFNAVHASISSQQEISVDQDSL